MLGTVTFPRQRNYKALCCGVRLCAARVAIGERELWAKKGDTMSKERQKATNEERTYQRVECTVEQIREH